MTTSLDQRHLQESPTVSGFKIEDVARPSAGPRQDLVGLVEHAGDRTKQQRWIEVALDFGGSPTDAISCSVPIERMHEGRDSQILEALRRTKLAIERMAPVAASSTNAWA